MGTEILRPQDCLIRDSSAVFYRRRSHYSNPIPRNGYHPSSCPNPKQNRRTAVRSDDKKRFGGRYGHGHTDASVSKRCGSDDSKTTKSGLVMEKVTILRRGESLDSKIRIKDSLTDGGLTKMGTERLGTAPEMGTKQIRKADPRSPEIFAGSACAVSPAPSSLPLPSFSRKKSINIDDSATRDLRRLLRLEF